MRLYYSDMTVGCLDDVMDFLHLYLEDTPALDYGFTEPGLHVFYVIWTEEVSFTRLGYEYI